MSDLNPRLESSVKSISLPQDFLRQVAEVINEHFSQELGDGVEVRVSGKIFAEETILLIELFLQGDDTPLLGVCSSTDRDDNTEHTMELLHSSLDITGGYIDGYIQGTLPEQEQYCDWKVEKLREHDVFTSYIRP